MNILSINDVNTSQKQFRNIVIGKYASKQRLCPLGLTPWPAKLDRTPACPVVVAPPDAECPGAAWQLLLLRPPAETAAPADNERWPSPRSH